MAKSHKYCSHTTSPQITHLTNIKDAERLNVLKQVAGTGVYEQRRQDSLKILNDKHNIIGKTEELLTYIEERLQELEEEKKELKDYYEKDKDRRCLEYAIYQRELANVTFNLDELEADRRNDAETSAFRQTEFRNREKELARLEQEVADVKQLRAQKQIEKESLIEEKRGVVRQLAQLDAQLKDQEDNAGRLQDRRATMEQRLADIEAEIEDKEAQLASTLPQWEQTSSELDDATQRLQEIRARVAMLRSKGGRSAQFRDQAERDVALQAQIQELVNFETSQLQRRDELTANRERAEVRLAEIGQIISSREEQLQQRKQSKEEATRLWNEKKIKREELIERKKELLKGESKLSSSTAHASEKLRDAQRALARTMDKATAQGLQAVEQIAKQHGISGIAGPLYQLFTVDDKYQEAAEVTANTSLFHVVVDTDETASKVLAIMNKNYTGRVTFMPLNRLKPKESDLPSGQEAIPLISKIRYDAKYAQAMKQVFGQMLVCPSLEIATAYVRSHGVNTITLDGDKAERGGALTGGYHDPRRSRLGLVRDVKRWKDVLDTDGAQLEELRETTVEMEQEITTLVGEMQALESKVKQASNSRGPILEELQWLRAEEHDVTERLARARSQESALEREIRSAVAQRESLEQEIKTPLRQGLSSSEQDELKRLDVEETTLTRSTTELESRFAELSSKKNDVEIELNELLKRERDSLAAELEDLGENASGDDLQAADEAATEQRKKELQKLKKQRDTIKDAIAKLEAEQEELGKKVQETSEQLDKTFAEQTETARAIERQQKSIDSYLSKRQRLLDSKDRCNGHIRDLGVLPEEAYVKYIKTSIDKVVKRLHKANDGLKKYSQVNKKAVEQYNNSAKQRDQLTERLSELSKSAEAIQDLIKTLDQRKEEAIERTFKQVSKNFEEVFSKLVPAGRGRLIMQKGVQQREDDSDEEMKDDANKSTIDSYTGVSIKVSFNSRVDEGLRIQQLSGGQKSLVALATVFAIQKCDPAPFYLFDEIDANLDAQYRTAVAAMIHELATDTDGEDDESDQQNGSTRQKAQFITTTFRPEMVQVADKHYGVFFDARKISNIRTISRDEAASFVDAAADASGR